VPQPDQQPLIKAIRAEIPEVVGIYFFGSAARGWENPESDLDLAVLADKPLDVVVLWQVSQKIATQIGREVDLIDLRLASLIMRHQVFTTGRRIYCREKFQCDLFETTSLAMYLDFNENRKELLEKVKNTGKVYG
jgi:predicted nucleotidyltransferase